MKHSILDRQCNKLGKELLDFLKDTKTCVLNGKFEDHLNTFTCISPRGKSFVDYCIVPHEQLKYCKSFNVHTCTTIVDRV